MTSPFVLQLLELSRVKPDNVFITDASGDIVKQFTYLKFVELLEERITTLRLKNLPKNSAIAVGRMSPLESIITVFAIWSIDCFPVMLNTMLSEQEQKLLFRFTQAVLMILQGVDKRITYIEADSNRKENLYPHDTAVVIFSSGSTDTPKAVPLSYENLSTAYRNGDERLNYSDTDNWLLSLPLFHISGFSIIIRGLLSGASITLCNNTLDFLESKRKSVRESITHISLVSTQLKNIINKTIPPPKNLKFTLLGGGPISAELAMSANDSGWNICKVYGSTETSAFVTALLPDELSLKSFSSGRPLNNVSIRIIGQNGTMLPPLSIGQVAIKSQSVFKGYYNGESVVTDNIKDGFFLTGDLGYLDKQGYLYIEGRTKRIIISGGENIDAEEIEKVIKEIEGVTDCVAFGIKSEHWGEELAAVISKYPNIDLSEKIIKEFLRNKIAGYKIPKKILILDSLPRNELGKIMLGEIRQLIK